MLEMQSIKVLLLQFDGFTEAEVIVAFLHGLEADVLVVSDEVGFVGSVVGGCERASLLQVRNDLGNLSFG